MHPFSGKSSRVMYTIILHFPKKARGISAESRAGLALTGLRIPAGENISKKHLHLRNFLSKKIVKTTFRCAIMYARRTFGDFPLRAQRSFCSAKSGIISNRIYAIMNCHFKLVRNKFGMFMPQMTLRQTLSASLGCLVPYLHNKMVRKEKEVIKSLENKGEVKIHEIGNRRPAQCG